MNTDYDANAFIKAIIKAKFNKITIEEKTDSKLGEIYFLQFTSKDGKSLYWKFPKKLM